VVWWIAGAALEAGEPLLQRLDRRVADPAVNVARLVEREQVRRVVGVVEHERGGLVDRRCPGAGRRVGFLAVVEATRLEAAV